MKSNDEYLDELLKSMEEDTSEEDLTSGEDFIEGSDDGEPFFGKDSGSTEEQSLSALAQLMAEMEIETAVPTEEGQAEDLLLSEEGVDSLLSSAKSQAAETAGEPVYFDMKNDQDMAEIEALLNMSDNNELIEDDPSLWAALENLEKEDNGSMDLSQGGSGAGDEVMELDPDELDAILSGEAPKDKKKEKKQGLFGKKDKKKEKEPSKESSGKPGESQGFFKKIFALLMEEVPEEEPAEASTLNLSEENKEILTQLDKEKKEKGKKKEKKPKKEKVKKEKKVKPRKEKKPKEVAMDGVPSKRLPRKKVWVTAIFAFSVLVAILVIDLLVPSVLSLAKARSAFEKGEYKEAFLEYYGRKLSEEDDKKYQGSTTVMRMQGSLDGYYSYTAMSKPVMALHSLLEGVQFKSDIFANAEAYGVVSQVQGIYQEILGLLSSEYTLTEEAAMSLVNETSNVDYTRKLEAITTGTTYVPEDTASGDAEANLQQEAPMAEISQEDLLPEEEQFFQEGE